MASKITTKAIIFILMLLCLSPMRSQAQTYLSQQSHKQGAENAISITSNSGAQTGIDVIGYSTLAITISGTYNSVAFKVEGSPDGTTYTATPLPMIRQSDGMRITSTGSISSDVDQYLVSTRGFKKVRINVTAWSSGTAVITQTPIAAPFTTGGTVTQATAANLNATVTGTVGITGTVTVGSHAVTNAGTFATQPAGSVAHDGAASAVNPVLVGGYASAAVPSDVSADTDSVRAWYLRSGAAAVQPTFAGVLGVAGNGASGTGVQRVTIASDSTGVVGLNTGTNVIGFVTPAASATTTNAASTYFLTSAASTNSTSVKGSAGNVYTIRAINTTATLYYLRMYNSSSAPTCSSATNFIETIPIPASTSGGGIAINQTVGQGYSTGIGFCLTGGGSSTDNTSAATGVYLTILYK